MFWNSHVKLKLFLQFSLYFCDFFPSGYGKWQSIWKSKMEEETEEVKTCELWLGVVSWSVRRPTYFWKY